MSDGSAEEQISAGISESRGSNPLEIYPEDSQTAVQMGYVKKKFDDYLGLSEKSEYDPTYLGSKVFIKYHDHTPNIESVTHGVIVRSQGGSLEIFDGKAGRVIPINSRDKISELYVLPSETEWHDIRDDRNNIDDLIQNFSGHQTILTAFTAYNGGENFTLAGRVRVAEPSADYRVWEIVDPQGKVHLLDKRYLFIGSFVVAKNKTDEIAGLSSFVRPDTLRFVDETREVRSVLVEKLIEDIVKNKISVFANHKLYEYLVDDLSSEQRQALLKKSYGNSEKFQNMLTFVKDKLGEEYTALLIDPGIVKNFDHFRQFLESSTLINESVFGIREQFSQYLGNTTVYRGMALISDEVEAIEQDGLVAPIVRNKGNLRDVLLDILDEHEVQSSLVLRHSTKISEGITERQTDLYSKPENYIFMSCSAFPEVAASVGWYDSHRTDEEGVGLYLMGITVPTLNIIFPMGPFQGALREKNRAVQIGEKTFSGDDKVEVFLPFCLPPNGMNIKQLKEIPQRWKFIKAA